MSTENFLSYLQQILSLVDRKDKYSVELARTAFMATISLVNASDKWEPGLNELMDSAAMNFYFLVENAKDFAGKPRKYDENRQKRRRLELTLRPHC